MSTNNTEMQYESSISKLQLIIQAFQQGNMQLNEAVAKYTESQILLKDCKEQLQAFQDLIQNKEQIIQDTNIEIERHFEKNLVALESICSRIESNKDIPLKDLSDLYQKGLILVQQCKKELMEFQHIIEHHKIKI